MNTTPPVSLERAFARHGDTLYRTALLLAGDDHGAAQALRLLVRQGSTTLPGEDLDDLLPALLAAISERRQPRLRRPRSNDDLFQVATRLPLAQRRMLALHLFQGQDLPLAAQFSGITEAAARADLAAALLALAPAASITLPAELPSEQCPTVRQTITAGPANAEAESLLRGHLAVCDTCRAYDSAWRELIRRVEAVLRTRLRSVTLPTALATDLARLLNPSPSPVARLVARIGVRRIALTAVPALVLLVIATLVLPGFFAAPIAAPAAAPAASADPRSLVQRASGQIGRPPAGTGVLWHGRWETIWYFPGGTFAPIVADAWLDPLNTARHRLQIVHGQGGAPYELQIGDGSGQMYYALSTNYAETIYGTTGPASQPDLVHRSLPPDAQQQALDARLRMGAWGVGADYLRQAYAATDLRLLGRQRDGDTLVQVLSFTGRSPLGLPSGASGASDDPVTVLLSLDVRDGFLRSATELLGQPGGGQTSQVTWRFRSGEWLTTESQARDVLDPARAWNGRGRFPTSPSGLVADTAMLLPDREHASGLERLLLHTDARLVVPASVPPGISRALVVWERAGFRYETEGTPPAASMVYLGEGRMLALRWGGSVDPAVAQHVGPWNVLLTARRGQIFQLSAKIGPPGSFEPAVTMLASGFSKAELLAVVSSLAPLDLGIWKAQGRLFAPDSGVAGQVYSTLAATLGRATPPAPNTVRYRREQIFYRPNLAPDLLADPYHMAPISPWQQIDYRENWYQPAPVEASYSRYGTRDGQVILAGLNRTGGDSWDYDGERSLLTIWQRGSAMVPMSWMNEGHHMALDMLSRPGEANLLRDPSGDILITRNLPYTESSYYRAQGSAPQGAEGVPYIDDLQPTRVITELRFSPEGDITGVQTKIVGAAPQPTLVQSWLLVAEHDLPADQAPADLQRPRPATDQARYVVDWSGGNPLASMVETMPLSDAVALSMVPLFYFPTDSQLKLVQVQGNRAPQGTRMFQNDVLSDAVRDGVALRLEYQGSDTSQRLTLVEGPAEPLGDYIRTHYNTPFWKQSAMQTIRVGSEAITCWVMWDGSGSEGQSWVFASLGNTLVVVEGQGAWFRIEGVRLLEALRSAQ